MGLGFDKNPNSLTGYGDEGSYGTRKAEGATVAVTKGELNFILNLQKQPV